MRFSVLLLSACLLPTFAHGDDIRTYDVFAVGLNNAYQTQGTFTINATTGSLLNIDLTPPAPIIGLGFPLVPIGSDIGTNLTPNDGPLSYISEDFGAPPGQWFRVRRAVLSRLQFHRLRWWHHLLYQLPLPKSWKATE